MHGERKLFKDPDLRSNSRRLNIADSGFSRAAGRGTSRTIARRQAYRSQPPGACSISSSVRTLARKPSEFDVNSNQTAIATTTPRRGGFTLVELLTAIGIIAVLVALLLLGIRHVSARAKTDKTRTVLAG